MQFGNQSMRKSLEILGYLSDGDMEWLLSAGDVVELRAGEILVSEGQMLDSVFFLVDGRLTLTGAHDNSDTVQLSPGEIVGEISAKPLASTVRAERAARVLQVRRGDLIDRCDSNRDFAKRFEGVLQTLLSCRMQHVLAEDEDDDLIQPETSNQDSVELDAAMLDQLARAAKRFDWIRSSG